MNNVTCNNSLDQQYKKLLADILNNGVEKDTRNGKTLSVFGRQIRHKMSEGFSIITTKKMYFNGVLTELFWFLQGNTNIKYLLKNKCNIWLGDAYKAFLSKNVSSTLSIEDFSEKILADDEFAKKWGELGPIYGKQWRNWFHGNWWFNGSRPMVTAEYTDQIQNVINELRNNPDSRKMVVSAWNAGEISDMVLEPCHYSFQLYTRELNLNERRILGYDYINPMEWDIHVHNNEDVEKICNKYNVPKRAISFMWNQRSVDTPLGLPFNISSYGLLLNIFAKMANMVPDELIGNLGDCHIYVNQIDGIKEQLTRSGYKLPTLNISNNINFSGNIDDMLNSCKLTDFTLENYKYDGVIKMPLSN